MPSPVWQIWNIDGDCSSFLRGLMVKLYYYVQWRITLARTESIELLIYCVMILLVARRQTIMFPTEIQ